MKQIENILIERGRPDKDSKNMIFIDGIEMDNWQNRPLILNWDVNQQIGFAKIYRLHLGEGVLGPLKATFHISDHVEIDIDNLYPAIGGKVLERADPDDVTSNIFRFKLDFVSLCYTQNADKGILSLKDQILRNTFLHRKGVVIFHREWLLNASYDLFKALYADFFPLFIEVGFAYYPNEQVRFVGYSPHFDVVEEGCVPPVYDFTFQRNENTGTVDLIRVDKLPLHAGQG